jgi:uncharacterized membrane protein SpoIIM required for sporulation
MTVRAFSDERKPRWEELRELVERAGRRPHRLGPDAVRRLGALYRATAADLALSRRLYPRDPVVVELEQLVARARNLVYSAATRRESAWQFAANGYWRLVAERRLALLLSALCLLAPAALAGTWALRDPGAAVGLAPAEYRSVTEPRSTTDLGLSADEEAAVSSEIFVNNIRVTLLTFAAGVLLGIGSALVLVFNGVLLGVVGGLAAGAGNGRAFLELVVAHGVLELSCIVVVGAAGLRLGWSIVEPGTRTRRDALLLEARPAVLVTLGTAPWLVLAGIVEGYVTGSGLGLGMVVMVGVGLAAVYWTLVAWRGRSRGTAPTGALGPSHAGTT